MILALLFVSVTFSVSIDFRLAHSSCPDTASFLDVLYNLPTCIVEKFFTSLVSGFVYSAQQFLENSLNFIITGPNLDSFCTPYSQVMRVLESLYTLALMGVGTYYIASAAEPERRVTAKYWIKNIFFAIILLTFSFSIFKMVVELNQYITTSSYSTSFSDLLDIRIVFSSLIFASVLSVNFVMAAGLTFITLLVRYLMIPILLLLFPIAIFLYCMPFTKQWGEFLLKFTLLIVFMTSIDAVIVLGLNYVFASSDPTITSGFVQGMALMLGFGLIGFVNSLIYAIATISLISGFTRVFDSVISIGWKIATIIALL